MLSPQLQRLRLYPVPTPSPAQPPLHSESRAPFNLTVISHLGAVAVVRLFFFFFSSKGRGRLGERDRGFSFLLHEREDRGSRGRSRAVGAVPWARPRARPGCAPHAVLLTSASSWASRKRPRRGNLSRPDSPPIRGPDSGRAVSDTGGLFHLRGPG